MRPASRISRRWVQSQGGGMKLALSIGALVTTALAAGVANAEPITVGKSNLVIDVEFWGRQELIDTDPSDVSKDIITYGDPVQGKFRIFAGDAPRTTNPTAAFPEMQNAVIYGRHPSAPGDPPPASFVTSNRASPFPGSIENDFVTIGDRL